MWIMQISRSWKKLFPIYEHKYQYNADISAYNSQEGEAQRIEETEEFVYDSEEMHQLPSNSEELASDDDDEYMCKECLQKQTH